MLCFSIVNRGNWLRNRVNIEEANERSKMYFGRPLTLHIFCIFFSLTMQELHNRNASVG